MGRMDEGTVDVVLVGAGIVSATLANLLAELFPDLSIRAYERLEGVAVESSRAMNNAGTGHAANCELNYTPRRADGSVDIAKALRINEEFEVSLQFWAHLVENGAIPDPKNFIHPLPHLSFVQGDGDVDFLRARHAALSAHPMFESMEFAEDPARMTEWMPLVMEGRSPGAALAATRVARGTDVDFGALAQRLFDGMARHGDFALRVSHDVTGLRREREGGPWRVTVRDRVTGDERVVRARFVFVGAGGGALPLLQRAGLPEVRGYGGFPVSGQWLVCQDPDVVARHAGKVYGKAALGAPPMSVPHLDTRFWHGRRSLLFGPYAGFTTKYLKQGSFLDLPRSLRVHNLRPMLAVARDNLDLVRYLVGQALQSPRDRLDALRRYMPGARARDWRLEIAGQRVQVIKPDAARGGRLEFGTEVVTAADGSLSSLLGASPGASTAVSTMLAVVERCLGDRLADPESRRRLVRMIPSYGRRLADDRYLLRNVRDRNDRILGLT